MFQRNFPKSSNFPETSLPRVRQLTETPENFTNLPNNNIFSEKTLLFILTNLRKDGENYLCQKTVCYKSRKTDLRQALDWSNY